MPSPEIDGIFRALDRPVWIITAQAFGRRGGLTATFVSPCSIDPQKPRLLAGINPSHFTAELIDQAGAFAAHLLRAEQGELAMRFALQSGRNHDKLAGLDLHHGASGSPLLADCLAWLDCRVTERRQVQDRNYYWADVLSGQFQHNGQPLREKPFFAAATDEQKSALRKDLQADIEASRRMGR